MGDNVISGKFKKDTPTQEVLEKAKEFELDEVILLGLKDNRAIVMYSNPSNILQTLGLLEYAKTVITSEYIYES